MIKLAKGLLLLYLLYSCTQINWEPLNFVENDFSNQALEQLSTSKIDFSPFEGKWRVDSVNTLATPTHNSSYKGFIQKLIDYYFSPEKIKQAIWKRNKLIAISDFKVHLTQKTTGVHEIPITLTKDSFSLDLRRKKKLSYFLFLKNSFHYELINPNSLVIKGHIHLTSDEIENLAKLKKINKSMKFALKKLDLEMDVDFDLGLTKVESF